MSLFHMKSFHGMLLKICICNESPDKGRRLIIALIAHDDACGMWSVSECECAC